MTRPIFEPVKGWVWVESVVNDGKGPLTRCRLLAANEKSEWHQSIGGIVLISLALGNSYAISMPEGGQLIKESCIMGEYDTSDEEMPWTVPGEEWPDDAEVMEMHAIQTGGPPVEWT